VTVAGVVPDQFGAEFLEVYSQTIPETVGDPPALGERLWPADDQGAVGHETVLVGYRDFQLAGGRMPSYAGDASRLSFPSDRFTEVKSTIASGV